MTSIKSVAYRNKFTGMIWTLEQQPGAESEPEIYEPLVLLSDVNGLVAENLAVKKYAKIDDYDKCDNCGFESYVMPIETPNTDAFTAELRAQGVDELAEAWEAIKPEEGVSMSESTVLKYKQRAQDAREFAANLRAGRKG